AGAAATELRANHILRRRSDAAALRRRIVRRRRLWLGARALARSAAGLARACPCHGAGGETPAHVHGGHVYWRMVQPAVALPDVQPQRTAAGVRGMRAVVVARTLVFETAR